MLTTVAVRRLSGTPRGSSHRWLARQRKDPFVQAAKEQGLRSRAAFKLQQIDRKHRVLRRGSTVVDLGAAPGGWTQWAVGRTGARHTDTVDATLPPTLPPSTSPQQPHRQRSGAVPAWEIAGVAAASTAAGGRGAVGSGPPAAVRGNVVVAVDLAPMDAVPGAVLVQGDFTKAYVQDAVRSLLPGSGADAVLSDMAPAFCGHRATDSARSAELAWEAFQFAVKVLHYRRSCLVLKTRRGGFERDLLAACEERFREAAFVKPPASRADSAEIFLVCKGLLA